MDNRITEYLEKKDAVVSQTQARLEPISRPTKDRFPQRYRLHQYWSRKPWYVVRQYIEMFTEEGETVLDPFVGSGVTACEALNTRRKIIASDLNPIATFISKATCLSPVDLNQLCEAYQEIEREVGGKINGLYETTCPKCGSSATIVSSIWKDAKPETCFYSCETSNHRGLKAYDEKDFENLANIRESPFWIPRDVALPSNSDVGFLHELFTKRNILALSLLLNEIEKTKKPVAKDLLLLMFSSTIVRCSKLIFINQYRLKQGINPPGVWGEKRFWVPQEYAENNVWYYFGVRLPKMIKAKRETNALIGNYYNEDVCRILTASSIDLSHVPDGSVDYCFTDPPYGGSVQYSELSIIWNAWLRFPSRLDQEITINAHNTPQRYEESLTKTFEQIYRKLKKGHYLSVTFHSSNVRVWNSMLRACHNAGFEKKYVVPQEPIKRSLSQIQSKGSVSTDLIVTFRKPLNDLSVQNDRQIPDIDQLMTKVAREYLLQKETASTSEIYDAVVLEWISCVYGSPDISKKMGFSTRDLVRKLKEEGFECTEKKELDYKGCERSLATWRLPSSSA